MTEEEKTGPSPLSLSSPTKRATALTKRRAKQQCMKARTEKQVKRRPRLPGREEDLIRQRPSERKRESQLGSRDLHSSFSSTERLTEEAADRAEEETSSETELEVEVGAAEEIEVEVEVEMGEDWTEEVVEMEVVEVNAMEVVLTAEEKALET